MSTDTTNTYQSKQQASDDDIDLLALFFNILRGWKTILFLAFLGLMVGVLYSRYLNPTFKSDALIQIDEKSQGISALGANISELVSSDVSPAQTEAELIKSRMVLQPVVDLLHLRIRLNDETVSAVDRIRRNQTDTQVNTPENVTLNTEDGKIQISQFNVSKAYLNQNFTISRAGMKDGFILSNGFDEFKGEINQAHRFNGTDGVIQITVNDLPSANHPISLTKQSLHISMDALNGALSVVERGKQTGIIELSLIGTNQQQISRILEQIVKSYVGQNQSRGSEETTKTIDFMETQIPELKAKLESSEAVFNDFRKKYGTIDVSKEAEILLAENSQIDTQLNELKLKQVDLTTYYTNEHPLVIQINDQLKVLNARKKEIDDTIAGLPEVQREFLTLSEDVGINREIYLTMIKNYQQLKIVKAGQIGYARIIDMPIDTFRAIAPKKLLIMSLATILGAMIGTCQFQQLMSNSKNRCQKSIFSLRFSV
ncbi:GNVR domain-containing protein, partial [Psychrobacter sp. 16-MNA-CIBAN-0192]|uniref:GNVR domain-containing protein n=1 Tax=Psychrobacter sp. 16-MNA-CIBAN-0192 TaxID=3140448 RepID=UPI00331E17C7